jgi:hypothetical protein
MDACMRMRIISGLIIGLVTSASAQNKGAIEKKLAADFAPTQATADFTEIVTAGAILVLKQGTIVMGPAYQTNNFLSIYKDGKLTANLAGKLNNFSTRMARMPGSTAPAPTTRTFVPGEKMWVTKIECKDDGVFFELFTDAYAEVRYKAALKFAFDKKGAMPSADQMSKTVGEVFKVQPAEDQKEAPTEAPQQQAAPAPAPRGRAMAQPVRQPAPPPPAEAAPLAPIPPPPPPADDAPPKTISLGQTPDQVIGNFGQPEKKVKLGTKEIYYYKDIKVTFVNGKVSDVQ